MFSGPKLDQTEPREDVEEFLNGQGRTRAWRDDPESWLPIEDGRLPARGGTEFPRGGAEFRPRLLSGSSLLLGTAAGCSAGSCPSCATMASCDLPAAVWDVCIVVSIFFEIFQCSNDVKAKREADCCRCDALQQLNLRANGKRNMQDI